MTGGFARYQHYLRQLARLVLVGPPPRYAVAVGARRRRSIDDTLDELRQRRRRAQIAARHALKV